MRIHNQVFFFSVHCFSIDSLIKICIKEGDSAMYKPPTTETKKLAWLFTHNDVALKDGLSICSSKYTVNSASDRLITAK